MRARNVLVVSSSGRLGRRVSDALIAAECSVRQATSEACASVALLASHFDSVVIDRSLPMNGAAILLQRLTLLEEHVEVVVISDRSGPALDLWAAGSGLGSDTAQLLGTVCNAMAV